MGGLRAPGRFHVEPAAELRRRARGHLHWGKIGAGVHAAFRRLHAPRRPEARDQAGRPADPPFRPERWHCDVPPLCLNVSPDAAARWEADQRRFPAAAYEDFAHAWRGAAWRQLSPSERLRMLAYPTRYLDGIRDPAEGHAQGVQRRHRVVAHSCHLSSLCLAFTLLAATIPAQACPRWPKPGMAYSPDEAALRERIGHAVFDANAFIG